MRSPRLLALLITLLSLSLCDTSMGQYRRGYPGGYGGWGFSQWGADPGAGYMAGLGAYQRGMGAYELDAAKARSIERDSVLKWNAAVAETNRKKGAEDARNRFQDDQLKQAVAAQAQIANGSTLNALLNQILQFNPDGLKAAQAKAPLNRAVIQDIPFETASEPITLCLDQMTGADGWPTSLNAGPLAQARAAVTAAIDKALDEDQTGPVSDASLKAIDSAVADLRTQFQSSVPSFSPGYDDADLFLRSLAGLSGMLENSQYRTVLKDLETWDGQATLGDLIQFMHSFNLKFAPAESDRQREIYSQLAGALNKVLIDVGGAEGSTPPATVATSLPSAAQDVFRSMTWDDLQNAHNARPQ